MVPDPLTKDIIIRIFQMYFEGNSYQKIANKFNEEKVLNKTNWIDNTILNMISNPLYKGDYLHGKTGKKATYYEDVIEPIVSKEMRENCQAQQKKNSRSYSRNETYLFLQKLLCPNCGAILGGKATYKKKFDRTYYYYGCEHCKTGMEKQVGKTSIFTKESLVVIQDKMRSKCIEEFNLTYSKDNKLKKKEKGKNRDYSAYERLKFNEKAEKLKQELNELREDVSELKDNKQKINEEINDLNNDKEDIKKEIDKKKKVNNKIIIKSKNQLWDENEKLKDEISDLQRENYTLKNNYEDLEKRTNYLLKYLNKFLDKVPKIIKDIVNHLFKEKMYFLQFMQNYDPEQLEKNEKINKKQETNRRINLFNRNKNYDFEEEIEKDTDDFDIGM